MNKLPFNFGKSRSLSDFSGDWSFVSFGIHYSHTDIGDRIFDPVSDISGDPLSIFFHRFNTPLFSGMDVPGGDGWNNVLFFIDKDRFLKLEKVLSSMVFSNHDSSKVWSYGTQDILIPDALHRERSTIATPKMVGAICLGIDGSWAQVGVEPGAGCVGESVHHVVYKDCRESMLEVAKATKSC